MEPQPVYPKYRWTNRKEKRLIINEMNRLANKIGQVEDIFEQAVFRSPTGYEHEYQTHLEIFNRQLKSIGEPDYCVVNPFYFAQRYAPIRLAMADFIHTLHQLARMLFSQNV